MRIPNTLEIGAHTYKVQRGIVDKFGETDRVKQTITLDTDLTRSQLNVTLFHELFHALNKALRR